MMKRGTAHVHVVRGFLAGSKRKAPTLNGQRATSSMSRPRRGSSTDSSEWVSIPSLGKIHSGNEDPLPFTTRRPTPTCRYPRDLSDRLLGFSCEGAPILSSHSHGPQKRSVQLQDQDLFLRFRYPIQDSLPTLRIAVEAPIDSVKHAHYLYLLVFQEQDEHQLHLRQLAKSLTSQLRYPTF